MRGRELGTLLRRGVESGVFPGAVAVVCAGGQTVFQDAVGHAQVQPERRVMSPGALFDLASLTKVLCTVPVILRLCADGRVDLDEPLRRWLPELEGASAGQATLRQALAHTTGLPAWRPLYLHAHGREAVVRAIAAVPLEAVPGSRVLYSDLGMLLAGFAAERAAGVRVDVLFQEHVAAPLGLREAGFRLPPDGRNRCAATEEGNAYERGMAGEAGRSFRWREGVIVGEVHDGNAYYALDGVAPHAGLFSPASEVVRAGVAWLRPGRWLPEGWVAEALRDQRRGARGEPRGLGWVLHHREAFFAAFGPRSFGHTGFTGTAVAGDPDRELVAVLLTNRVHPYVREGIEGFRRAFFDAVAEMV
ncbi:MAG: serine hydrolase domain-containing protein [Armatimonadota bacterium]|nr:serine hydrolase domain-containing protein [Armatimonadota bacterium]MDR7514475.1 serine hydrolase domain-containing protein [Armatimonadota bacterium]